MSVQTSITLEQKKRRFRALTKEENIRTGRQIVSEREQPFLPFYEFEKRTQNQPTRPTNERS